jgi:hypothetical protein
MSRKVYEALRKYKFYNGKQEPMKISASQCGAPILQIYLSQTTKVVEQPNVFTKATIGSISHIGMEHLVDELKDESLETEVDMTRMLDNGWKITGTADLIDNSEKVILDYKFQMNFAYKQLLKSAPTDSYNMQGAAYSWLEGNGYDFVIMSFITDHSPIKKDHPAEAIQVTKMPIYENIDFENLMIEKTNTVQDHIDDGTTPAKCDDVWWRVVNGKKIPTRCAFYCQYKDVCPHYGTHHKAQTRIASWG